MAYKYPKKRKQFSGQIYVLVKEYNDEEKAKKRAKSLRKQGFRARYIKDTRGYGYYFAVYKRDLTVGKTRIRREKKHW